MTATHIKAQIELEKKFYMQLVECIATTRELADAVARQDQVSITLLLSLRQRSILEMQETRAHIDLIRVELSAPDASRFDELRTGVQARNADETPLVETLATNRRMLTQLGDLDRQLNVNLCGESSIYRK